MEVTLFSNMNIHKKHTKKLILKKEENLIEQENSNLQKQNHRLKQV